MTTRRTVLKAMSVASAGVATAGSRAQAASADPTRIGLVVGNAAYAAAPLANPRHDAAAMGDLLASAGFDVDARFDTTRAELLAAVDSFAEAALRPATRLAVFYYAGHGAQLEWRNYLLPTDVTVRSAEELRRKCVDLGTVFERLAGSKHRHLIFILDACRDNPFASGYQPTQKGLSQFDAPAGTLIAFSTSPGRVAGDGVGRHGLYTQHLLLELSNRSARLEDALKRVRLSVRLGSNGRQVPWESTSLESDVFLFPDTARARTADELERELAADLTAWRQVRDARTQADWLQYLRHHPNGRFAEIAQARLATLPPAAEPAAAAAGTPDTSASSSLPTPMAAAARVFIEASDPGADTQVSAPRLNEAPRLVLDADSPLTVRLERDANPYSAGRFALGRRFSVGDRYEYRGSDELGNGLIASVQLDVTLVDPSRDRVEMNDGQWVFDLLGNRVRHPQLGENDVPQQLIPAELQVGRKWKAGWVRNDRRTGRQIIELDCHTEALEDIAVPAGTFQAFRIRGRGWKEPDGIALDWVHWVVPGLNVSVRVDILSRNRRGVVVTRERWELVRAAQQEHEQGCAPRPSGTPGTLVIGRSCAAPT